MRQTRTGGMRTGAPELRAKFASTGMAVPTKYQEFWHPGLFDEVRVAIKIPAWVTGYEIEVYRWMDVMQNGAKVADASGIFLDEQVSGGPFTANEQVYIYVMDEPLYVRVHSVTGTINPAEFIYVSSTGVNKGV